MLENINYKLIQELKKSKIPWAIIIGMEMRTSLAIIRSLGRENIPVLGINLCQTRSFVTYSKYCQIVVNIHPQKLIDFLLRIGPYFSSQPIIFPESDEICIIIDNNKIVLNKFYKIMKSKKYKMEELINKAICHSIFKIHGEFDIPKTIYLNDNDNLYDKLKYMSYPCIIKPIFNKLIAKEEYIIVKDIYEAIDAIKKIRISYNKILIQEYIDTPDNYNYEVLCYRSEREERSYCCAIRKLRIYPKNTGSSSYIETTTEIDNIFQTIDNFLSKIEYNGLVDFEFKIKEEKLYLIEANFRSSANIIISERCKINLPYIAYSDMANFNKKYNYEKYLIGIKWSFENSEILQYLNGYISIRALFKSLLLSDSHAIFQWDDIKPGKKMVIEIIKKKIKKIF